MKTSGIFSKPVKSVALWVVLSVVTGIVTGVVGAVFHKAIDLAGELRTSHTWLVFLLPAGGILITALYKLSSQNLTTNSVIESIRNREPASPLLAPFIFIGAFITHLFGGSAGREGAALQIGGGIASCIGRILKLSRENLGTIIMCGMSGAFAAIFTTPVTATVFAMEVVSVGHFKYYRFLPCILSASVAYIVSMLMGNHRLFYDSVVIPDVGAFVILKVVIFSVLVSLLSTVFCIALAKSEHLFEKYIRNQYLISVAGGIIIVVLTLIVGNNDYNGAGMDVIAKALSGKAFAGAFAIKLLFTAVTVGAGYKGGEIVPAFFVGACFGATVAPLLGLDPSFAAMLGLVCMFCGISNCPVASLVLGIELFGSTGILFFAISCAVCYIASGNFGLYGSQKLVYSKYSIDQVDRFLRNSDN